MNTSEQIRNLPYVHHSRQYQAGHQAATAAAAELVLPLEAERDALKARAERAEALVRQWAAGCECMCATAAMVGAKVPCLTCQSAAALAPGGGEAKGE